MGRPAINEEAALRWYLKRKPGGTREAALRAYETTLRTSREAKRRRQGKCIDCGAPTRYAGTTSAISPRCRECAIAQRTIWTREAIIEAIRAYAAQYGRPPAARDWNPNMALATFRDDIAERFAEDGRWPLAHTVQAAFGSWNAGIAAAGYAPLRPGQKYSDGNGRLSVAREKEDT